jgi:hypothetical protein
MKMGNETKEYAIMVLTVTCSILLGYMIFFIFTLI